MSCYIGIRCVTVSHFTLNEVRLAKWWISFLLTLMFFDLINISLRFWSPFPEVEERLLWGVRAHRDWGEARKWHILVSLVTDGDRMPGGQVVQPGWSGFPENSLHSQGTREETQEPRSGAKGRSEDLRTWQPWVMELVQNGKWYGKIPGIWALLWVPCPSFVGSPFHSVRPGWNWACWHCVLAALATSKDLLGNYYILISLPYLLTQRSHILLWVVFPR